MLKCCKRTFTRSHSASACVRMCAHLDTCTRIYAIRLLFKLVRFYRCHTHAPSAHTVISFRVQFAYNFNLSLNVLFFSISVVGISAYYTLFFAFNRVLFNYVHCFFRFRTFACMVFFRLNDVICIRCATQYRNFISSSFFGLLSFSGSRALYQYSRYLSSSSIFSQSVS